MKRLHWVSCDVNRANLCTIPRISRMSSRSNWHLRRYWSNNDVLVVAETQRVSALCFHWCALEERQCLWTCIMDQGSWITLADAQIHWSPTCVTRCTDATFHVNLPFVHLGRRICCSMRTAHTGTPARCTNLACKQCFSQQHSSRNRPKT